MSCKKIHKAIELHKDVIASAAKGIGVSSEEMDKFELIAASAILSGDVEGFGNDPSSLSNKLILSGVAESAEEAIAMANDSNYGLYTRSLYGIVIVLVYQGCMTCRLKLLYGCSFAWCTKSIV